MPQLLTRQFPPPSLTELGDIWHELTASKVIGKGLEGKLRGLVRQHVLLNYTWNTGHTFWRGRILKTAGSQYGHLREMLWPPSVPHSPLGRANLHGEPILYVSDHVPTVVAELCGAKPSPMQFVGLEIRPGEQMRFMPIGEIWGIWNSGKSLATDSIEYAKTIHDILSACEPGEAERLARADQILFDAFAHPTFHEVTAIVANEVRLKLPEVDGIMYQSVKKTSGRNVAVQPYCAMAKCNVVAGFVADACSISTDGKCSLKAIEGLSGIENDGSFAWTGKMQTETQLAAFQPSLSISLFDI
jgi:hypothetical protein